MTTDGSLTALLKHRLGVAFRHELNGEKKKDTPLETKDLGMGWPVPPLRWSR